MWLSPASICSLTVSQHPNMNLHIKIWRLPFDAIKRLSSSPRLLTTLQQHKVYLYRLYLRVPGGLPLLLKTHLPSGHTEEAACHLTHLLSPASRSFYSPHTLAVRNKCIRTNRRLCVMSGSHREVDKDCALLGHYAARSGNFLPTSGTAYRSHMQGRKVPLLAA